MPHSTFKIAASTSCDLGTRSLWPYREKRTGSHGSSATTIVGTPPAAKLRTAPRPMASELRTTAHGLRTGGSVPCGEKAVCPWQRGASVTVPAKTGDVPRERAPGVPGSDHKTTERAERIGGSRP